MKNNKLHKILALLLMGILIFSLVACGSKAGTQPVSGEGESTENNAETSAEEKAQK